MKYSRAYLDYCNRHQHCEVCGMPAQPAHHIRSRGAHGPVDDARNLLGLCARHYGEIHAWGPRRFATYYPRMAGKINAALEMSAAELGGMRE